MKRMKDIFIDTMNEVDGLTDVELRILVSQKNKELNLKDEDLLNMMDEIQLVSLIGDKNILLASSKK